MPLFLKTGVYSAILSPAERLLGRHTRISITPKPIRNPVKYSQRGHEQLFMKSGALIFARKPESESAIIKKSAAVIENAITAFIPNEINAAT